MYADPVFDASVHNDIAEERFERFMKVAKCHDCGNFTGDTEVDGLRCGYCLEFDCIVRYDDDVCDGGFE